MSGHREPASVTVRGLVKEFDLQSGVGGATLLRMLTGQPAPSQNRKVAALQGVDLDIREGERVGVIGRNGAGKTTLLSLLAGVSSPTSGTIEVKGDVHAMLTIGAVLRDELSGRENVRLDRAVHGLTGDEIDARIDEIVAFSELGEFIDRPVRTYSSGMKARLAFAMGAFVSPDILIIDETLSVGDAFFSAKATARMREIAADGRIVIVVSHGLSSIVDMCTRCLWLDEGRIVMDGHPAEVTSAYEKSVSRTDDADLAAKFASDEKGVAGTAPDALDTLRLEQAGEILSTKARPFVPLLIVANGKVPPVMDGEVDLELTIRRVDGRLITARKLSETGSHLAAGCTFQVHVELDPMILGSDLYRLEIVMRRGPDVVSRRARVLDVVDEEGQFGGRPLLYLSPQITSRLLPEVSQ